MGAAGAEQRRQARLGLGILVAALPGGLPKRPSLELILHGERHSLQRDAAAIRYHYDVGNEFFGAVPRRVDDLQLRDLLEGRARRSRTRSSQSWI